MPCRVTQLDADVAPFDVAFLLKLVAKRFEQARLQVLGKDADTVSFLLLRVRCIGQTTAPAKV